MLISALNIKAKFVLDFWFNYRADKLKIMHINLIDYFNCKEFKYNNIFLDDYVLTPFQPELFSDKEYVHYNCFPASRIGSVDVFVNSFRFIPKLSFLLYKKSTEEYIGSADIQKIFGIYCLTNVAVLPRFRGSGLGKFLVNKALIETFNNDVKDLFLLVRPNNERAMNLYNSVGFDYI